VQPVHERKTKKSVVKKKKKEDSDDADDDGGDDDDDDDDAPTISKAVRNKVLTTIYSDVDSTKKYVKKVHWALGSHDYHLTQHGHRWCRHGCSVLLKKRRRRHCGPLT
jgi:hypothetical protein